jgi:YVTN family beta-propeller protein
VEFRILGPVAAREDGRDIALGGPKQRALLAILLLHANEAVSRDRLIDGVWGERPPATVAHTLDNYVLRLRKALGDDRLLRRTPGYMLRVEREELDLHRFERLLQEGRERRAHGDALAARTTLGAALDLWRGQALGDLLYQPFGAEESERLEEQRLQAFEERVEADLELGLTTELVPELEALTRKHPFRERLLGQLMVALYRGGRQAEALAAFQVARQRSAEELGLEPSAPLQELQRQILAQDPNLDLPRAKQGGAKRKRSRRRRRVIVVAAAAAALGASATIGIMLGTGSPGTSSSGSQSSGIVALSSRSGNLVGHVSLDSVATAAASDTGSLWLASASTGAVVRIDPSVPAVVDRVPIGGSPGTLAVGGGAVWVATVPGDTVTRIDPKTGTVTQTIPLGGARAAALAFGGGGLWIADITDSSLLELDPRAGTVRRTLTLHLRPTALAFGDGVIWAADYEAGSIAEVDLRTGETLATVHVGNGPVALATGFGAVWVANSLDSTVSRVDPATGSVTATIPVGTSPNALAVAGDSIWVANQYSPVVSRIDASRNAVVRALSVGGGSTALAVVGGRIWIGVQAPSQHRGGTLRLLHSRPITIDPALQLDLFPLQSDGLTRDGLVTYNHAPGPAGIRLVPDLAINVPVPTDGGTTYTFRLRLGIRYSDGRRVRAADFRRALERVFNLQSGGRDLFGDIIGAGSCAELSTSSCDLSRGIVTDDAARTVTFHLRSPDPYFLDNLTVGGLGTPVPPGTPAREPAVQPIPGTGPYKIESATPSEIRYVRNPFFDEWSHAAQPDGNPDKIVMRFGLSPKLEGRAIEEGRADWSADNLPAGLLPDARTRFADQLHTNPTTETDFFQLNTTAPPFNDVRVRQALNLAIDRRMIARIYGGAQAATPTCQVLPPGVPGYRRYCPYTRHPRRNGAWTAPDLARARRLIAASGTRGANVTVSGWTDDPTISPRVTLYIAEVLRRLGYRANAHLVPHASFAPPASIQLIPAGWLDIAAYNFFAHFLSCQGEGDHGWFCDPRLDRAMRYARSLDAANPRAAASLWATIDRDVVDQAAWVPLVNPRLIDLVSARVGNYQFHPYWGIMADQLWLR